MLPLILVVVVVALVFEFINGFHDTANAIATSVGTKVMTPSQAIALSTVFNLVGALMGTAVAKTIGQGIVDVGMINLYTILCALIAGIIWNRLNKGMKLQIDATSQYIKGREGNWWPRVSPEDHKVESAYNTYIYIWNHISISMINIVRKFHI